ncbi:MAG: hypothetical protein HQM10_04585 [Candidatus Riflebacteria bacterium]|nr:hypothetical protein [Candidatus Riflebacteria bacterium]
MATKPSVLIEQIEHELATARDVMAPKRKVEDMKASMVQSCRFYHNSKTKHNAITFILENGEVVYKEIKETDWLNVVATFTRVKELVVWYDKDKMVQQFVLNHNY